MKYNRDGFPSRRYLGSKGIQLTSRQLNKCLLLSYIVR